MSNLLNDQARQDAEATLKPKITFWVKENIDNGISGRPDVTYRIVHNEEPALFNAVGRKRVYELCNEMHAFEDVDQSLKYTTLFDAFNQHYFDGALPHYQVRVVADVFFWIASQENTQLNLIDLGAERVNLADPDDPYCYAADDLEPSRIDLVDNQIILPNSGTDEVKLRQLIHHMARAASNTLTDRDAAWQTEMRRLHGLALPLGDEYLDMRPRTGEYLA